MDRATNEVLEELGAGRETKWSTWRRTLDQFFSESERLNDPALPLRDSYESAAGDLFVYAAGKGLVAVEPGTDEPGEAQATSVAPERG